ncbi:MAG: flagellar basal body P-ring formation chaperone FlgA [Alphaproteobacteria bacterium]
MAAFQAAKSVEVLTWSHSLEAGDIVQADDLTWSSVPRAPDGAAADADDLIGKAAKRPLRTGAVASRRDVSLPQVIKKDDLVYVTYSAGGVTLEMKGKAKGPAALGDNVDVVNTVSGKIIQAIASGPGRALVGPEGQALRATALTDPSRLASR